MQVVGDHMLALDAGSGTVYELTARGAKWSRRYRQTRLPTAPCPSIAAGWP